MQYKTEILNYLKNARLKLNDAIQAVESDGEVSGKIKTITTIIRILRHADKLLLRKHVKTCVRETLKHESADKSIFEIIAAYTYAGKV